MQRGVSQDGTRTTVQGTLMAPRYQIRRYRIRHLPVVPAALVVVVWPLAGPAPSAAKLNDVRTSLLVFGAAGTATVLILAMDRRAGSPQRAAPGTKSPP